MTPGAPRWCVFARKVWQRPPRKTNPEAVGGGIRLILMIVTQWIPCLIHVKTLCNSTDVENWSTTVMRNGTQSIPAGPQEPSDKSSERSRRIDSAAWAVFFIWVGVTMLAHLPWAWFLVGVGVFILGAQICRSGSLSSAGDEVMNIASSFLDWFVGGQNSSHAPPIELFRF